MPEPETQFLMVDVPALASELIMAWGCATVMFCLSMVYVWFNAQNTYVWMGPALAVGVGFSKFWWACVHRYRIYRALKAQREWMNREQQ